MGEGWSEAVEAAKLVGDEQRLRALYALAVEEIGPDAASHEWLAVMSGLDSSAAT